MQLKHDLILFFYTHKNKALNKCGNDQMKGLDIGMLIKKNLKKNNPHLCQVKLIIVPAVVLAFIIVASGNDDVHSDHAQDEHVEHRGPHQLLWKQSSIQLQSM